MEVSKVYEELLEMKIAFAKLSEKCDNLSNEIEKLKDAGSGSGIYLDGVPEIYKKQIERELSNNPR